MDHFIKDAEVISLFCRTNLATKRELPIRASEMGMLIYIVNADHPIVPIQIADFFKVTKPMVTTMANQLIKKGYLIKSKSITDGRSVILSPTAQGIQLVDETYDEYLKSMKLLKEEMGVEKYNQLIELLALSNQILLGGK